MYHVMTLPSFNKFSMFELKIYLLKTVDRSVGSMKGRAVTRTGRYVYPNYYGTDPESKITKNV